MKNNKSMHKQAGGINKFLLLFIVGGLAYSGYLAKQKGLISAGSMASVSSSVGSFSNIGNSIGSKFSGIFSSTFSGNNDFTGYGIQLMATSQLDQAKSLMKDFAGDGYSAFVLASEAHGRTLYKVRLGPYAHKPEAVAVQDKVIRRYPNSPFVKQSLVIYKPD